MKRKFVKVMFFGALALSTVTYVGCKDYDDDIDNLQTQIDANKASIAELQNFVKEGKWVTNVEQITDGFKITFNDNKSYSITSGKDATPTTIKIDPVTKNWIVNDNDLGICAEGKKGADGKPGAAGSPGGKGEDGYAPQISENGFWMVWDAETKKPVETKIKAATDIYVAADASNPLVWILNIFNKETKEWETVSMPKSARITSMSVLGIKGDGSVDVGSTEAETTLYYSIAGKDIVFNGNKTFKKKGDLLVARGGSKIHALINPVNLKAADIQAYEIGLTDSKGNTNFAVANIADNFSIDALTRAADPEKEPTANKGVYDLTLKFVDGLTKDELTALESAETAYALTTKDAWGNEIISQYGVKIKASSQNIPNVNFTAPEPMPYQTTYNLDELFGSELDKVVAYYYEVTDDEAKKADAKFDKEKNTILANKEGQVKVKIHCLLVDGSTQDPEVELTFTYVSKKAEIKDMTWVVDASNKTATSEIVGPSVDEIKGQIKLSDPIVATIAYTDDKAMINGKVVQSYMDGSIQLKLVGLDKDGKPVSGTSEADIAKITKFVIQATFDEKNVAAVSHTATVKFKNKDSQAGLGNDFLYETTFKITVDQQNDKLFTFKRATAYFDGDNAKAYGTVPTTAVLAATADTKIGFDLYTLYKEGSISADKQNNITFTEEKPSRVVSGKKQFAPAWLDETLPQPTKNSKIKVFPYVSKPATDENWGGAYTGRYITVSYAPFGNSRLKAITDRFNLTILSEIFEGTFEYTKEVDKKIIGTEANPLIIEGNTVEISAKDFKRIDARGNSYEFSDNRIESVSVVLADDDATTYLAKNDGNLTDDPKKVVISKKEGAVILTPPTCKVNVNILDKWGRTKSVSIYVKVNK
ncbi:PL29 family lyase N-terminal domain-containing protein, partial [Bacteroides ovatus]